MDAKGCLPSNQPFANILGGEDDAEHRPVHEPSLKINLGCGSFGERFIRRIGWVEERACQADLGSIVAVDSNVFKSAPQSQWDIYGSEGRGIPKDAREEVEHR